jgi:hypothetical protein
MRSRLFLFVFITALVLWTAFSYVNVVMFAGMRVCALLQTVGDGSTPHPMTQAEMDAKTAACNRPNSASVAIAVIGYVVILGVGAAYATGGKPELSGDP